MGEGGGGGACRVRTLTLCLSYAGDGFTPSSPALKWNCKPPHSRTNATTFHNHSMEPSPTTPTTGEDNTADNRAPARETDQFPWWSNYRHLTTQGFRNESYKYGLTTALLTSSLAKTFLFCAFRGIELLTNSVMWLVCFNTAAVLCVDRGGLGRVRWGGVGWSEAGWGWGGGGVSYLRSPSR